jgi:hypothetical protein
MENPKSRLKRCRRWFIGAMAGAATLAASTLSWAQTCPLCYRAAAASKAGALQALRSGVLILMIPPVVIFGVVTAMAIRGRDRFNDADTVAEEQPLGELRDWS